MRLKSGKVLKIKTRMYRKTELEDMDISFVENNIYFNKTIPSKELPLIKKEVMGI